MICVVLRECSVPVAYEFGKSCLFSDVRCGEIWSKKLGVWLNPGRRSKVYASAILRY
jgi:hypothetical protein